MLGQRLRRWPHNEPTLDKCTMFERKSSCPANARRDTTFSQQRNKSMCLLGPLNVFPFHKQIYIYIKVQKLSGEF